MHGVGQFVLNDPPKAKLSKFDGFCNFARKSFGSSFEHLFKVCWFFFVSGSLCFLTVKFLAHLKQLLLSVFIFQF